MAFGFNFNKTKILASAEKFVQQGKLQNAIAEYEKIIKEDPKDLTVLNTIGDLSARVGQNEQAAIYFRKAGDHYAQDGFTVKAIAIYKKLTRLNPGDLDHVTKLAELYTQQGLISDARAQYMQVADHFLKTGDNAQGARVLQRILELDPENTSAKSKLADLYLKLGKKEEARNIYYTAAESLYARGAYDAAEEALDRVIKMDPENSGALMLRGMIAADSGDNSAAIQYLSKVPDLHSRADGLRALLRAKLQANSAEGAENLASKLLAKHNDPSGIRDLAAWYAANDQCVETLRLYEENVTQMMTADRAAFQESLHPLIPKIKDDAEALAIMLRLLEKTEDSSHVAEIIELQAHASAHKGQFQQARDLYQKLSDLEPENSLHQQNYKQMQTKLGEDPASRTLSAEEAAQAFMVEALEEAAPAVHQNYDPTVEKAIEAALTDAELFVSYNVPAKAIPPLEAVLPLAPRDVTVNQRLATLYARGGRYADAARTCQTLSDIYRERGHEKEAAQYQEAAQSYGLRAPKSAALAAGLEVPGATVEIPAEQGTPSVQEFSFDVPDHLTDAESAAAQGATPPAAAVHEIKIEAVIEAEVTQEAPAVSAAGAQEVDVSSEWEDMLTVEAGQHTAIEIPAEERAPEASPVREKAKPAAPPVDQTAEKIKEIQFYIDQEMWDLAKKAILDLTEIAPDAPEITRLISAVSSGQQKAAATPPSPAEPPQAIAEFAIPAEKEPKAAPAAKSVAKSQASPEFVIAPVEISAEPPAIIEEFPLAEVVEEPKKKVVETPKQPVAPPPKKAMPAAPAPPQPVAAKPPRPQAEESLLEEILDIAPAAPVSKAPAARKEDEKKAVAADKKKEKTTEDILSDFVGDLEKTELVDFAPHPKEEPAKSKAPIAAKTPTPARSPVPAPPLVPAAAAAAPAPALEAHGGTNGKIRDTETNSLLTDILAELQDENVASPDEDSDAETHYNLGIAFKEMGLLDEAIGELQKVCHSIDRGIAFSQPIQAYTWLAQCLVDKAAPEAAVRWYQKALKLSGLDDSSRCAIYYDLAAAYEASGDEKSALANFMEVYGSNIDFRDVASRIKALKS